MKLTWVVERTCVDVEILGFTYHAAEYQTCANRAGVAHGNPAVPDW
jgi:hypothetical protein